MNTKRPVLIHIPHSSLTIPEEVRADMLISDSEIKDELLQMTDWYVDELFAIDDCERMMNNFSQLVFDPERFREDEKEAMANIGLGAIYIRTADGRSLRNLDGQQREELLVRYYDPYHRIFEHKVRDLLKWHGRCLIIDAHSYPLKPLPYEKGKEPSRPDICIGTDDYHTPPEISRYAWEFFLAQGYSVAENHPFAGSIVPFKYYQNDKRVASIMIEVKRSLYMNEATGEKSDGFDRTKETITGFLKGLRIYFCS